MDIDKLKEIGLNDKESRVYIALLELEDALVSEIAAKAKINRSLLYTILSSLAKKGIVTYILKNNVRYYRAAEPQKILAMMKEKEKILNSIMPDLIALHKPRKARPIVEVLEGREGLKTIMNDVLRQRKEWFAFNVPGKGPATLGTTVHSFQNERQKRGIKLNAIVMKTKQGIKRGKQFAAMKHSKARYMPETFASPASNWIYGDRSVILFWYKESPFAIRIIDKELADSYKNHFKALWSASKEL
jgi:predicted transcriptional regulator